jgi:hypothetical protein
VHGQAFATATLARRLDSAAYGPGSPHSGRDHGFAATRDAVLAGHLFASTAQRIALAVQHATCTADGCDIPAPWCDAHHRQPWSSGGRTDLTDLRLLGRRHHTLIHRSGYGHTDLAEGRVKISKTHRRRN